ncbi:hypothetical protein [Limnofasciculus baicalensis]|uniref:Uncharacterized protein n=1 Tax=Limnofasciculus baicalensis BBK-W-15 TaxID=2699891 RepID=A0AAE3KLU2_9CYAN|nr:hypothetical protein [Limnofasciculus baicalensis]MCP2727018.1 hypothetical protein [Limnofasciculus baicalensis BBK-W-15]
MSLAADLATDLVADVTDDLLVKPMVSYTSATPSATPSVKNPSKIRYPSVTSVKHPLPIRQILYNKEKIITKLDNFWQQQIPGNRQLRVINHEEKFSTKFKPSTIYH